MALGMACVQVCGGACKCSCWLVPMHLFALTVELADCVRHWVGLSRVVYAFGSAGGIVIVILTF